MYKVMVVVEGTNRGMLMNRFGSDARAAMESKVRKVNTHDLPPEEDAACREYRLQPKEGERKGQLYVPAEHFLGGLVRTGSGMKMKGKKTYKDAFKGSLDVSPDCVLLTNEHDLPIVDYAVDSRRVVNPSTRGAVIRHRPHVPAGWRASFTISVNDKAIPLEVVQAGLEEAGRTRGVGDYRPRFGTFRIVSFDRE